MPGRRPAWLPLALALAALALVCLGYMTLGVRGNWGFVIPYRGAKLVALLTVAAAVALSTLAFQTLTGNRILTPSIMGFDELYRLLQVLLVFALGGVGYASLGAVPRFGLETGLMVGASLLLFATLLARRPDLERMILTGIIFGVLFRSLTALLNRLIDPNEYAIVQSAGFARFNAVEPRLVPVALAATLAAGGLLFARRHRLDAMALGREAAIGLGLDYDRQMRRILLLVALLVSVSTALVGPVVFFGLLVSALTHQIARTWRHAVLLPLSVAVAATILVGAQTLFERVLRLSTTVAVVIELLGGLVFLALVLSRRSR